MSTNYVCDHCGEAIDEGRHASLTVFGHFDREYGPDWYQRHYHAESCRPCFKIVCELIDAAGEQDPPPRHQTTSREDAWLDERESWKRTPKPVRDRLALEALGDQRLTSKEMRECLREKLGQRSVYTSDSNQCLKRLLDSGEVLRDEIPGYRGGPHPRWRYFRNANLSGPIVDLERTFHDETGRSA